jgi:hypothetical protein
VDASESLERPVDNVRALARLAYPPAANSAALLILDEPTSGVHIQTQHEVLYLLRDIISESIPFYWARMTLPHSCSIPLGTKTYRAAILAVLFRRRYSP